MIELVKNLNQTLGDLSFWIGLLVVFVFAHERFGKHEYEVEELEFPIPIRSFTTRFRYAFAASVYGGSFACYYICLILIGSTPSLQGVIKQWFGTIGTEQHYDIGTPIGAAMIAMSIVPSIPFMRTVDLRVRAALRDFASIPLKARYIAELIIGQLTEQQGLSPANEATDQHSDDLLNANLAIYGKMKEMIQTLQRSKRLRAARKYAAFFHQYRNVEDGLDESIGKIAEYKSTATANASFMAEQAGAAAQKLSRYLACALLVVEADEYSAMKVISEELKIPNVRLTGWRFKPSQIALGAVTIFGSAIIGSIISALILYWLSPGTELDVLGVLLWPCLFFSVLIIPIFIFPLIFAAGANMYLLDRRSFGEHFDWDDRVTAFLATLAGCLFSALLTILVVGVISAHAIGDTLSIGEILPWALLPTGVAVTFFVVSGMQRAWNRPASDFLLHALSAVVTALIAQRLSIWAGLGSSSQVPGFSKWLESLFALLYNTAQDPAYLRQLFLGLFYYAVTEPPVVAAMAAMIGGSLGALQCAISRQSTPRQRRFSAFAPAAADSQRA